MVHESTSVSAVVGQLCASECPCISASPRHAHAALWTKHGSVARHVASRAWLQTSVQSAPRSKLQPCKCKLQASLKGRGCFSPPPCHARTDKAAVGTGGPRPPTPTPGRPQAKAAGGRCICPRHALGHTGHQQGRWGVAWPPHFPTPQWCQGGRPPYPTWLCVAGASAAPQV